MGKVRRKYWVSVWKEALRRACRRVMNSPGGAIISVASAFGLIWGLSVWGSPDAANDEIVTRTLVAGFSVAVLVGSWLYEMLSIPAEWGSRDQAEIASLKEKMQSVVNVSWDSASGQYTKPIGEIQRALGGNAFTDHSRTLSEIRVRCDVEGAVSVEATGYLISVFDEASADVNLIGTPMPLRWSHQDLSDPKAATLHPGVPAYLIIFERKGGSHLEVASAENAEAVFALANARKINFYAVVVGNGAKSATINGNISIEMDASERMIENVKIEQIHVTQVSV